ncbi:carboxymuconolactone decarboxylase family protein [Kosakonia sp. YIM B13611]|uniref:carboxymuconolactone decarboxylase family protein n=1 Tax=unclassified Kosakonia TaxID=2632876 RepID=UPI0036835162
MKRPNWFQVSAESGKAMKVLHHYATTGTDLPANLIHLIFLRVSKIKGCAHCIDILSTLSRLTFPLKTVVLVPVWREATYLFSDIDQAALSWAEEITHISETHACDEAYSAALSVFGEKDLVELTLVIATMNAINRMGISFRMKPLAKA